jgi:hypothetical protein
MTADSSKPVPPPVVDTATLTFEKSGKTIKLPVFELGKKPCLPLSV